MSYGILSDNTVAMSSFDWKPLVFGEDEKFERNYFCGEIFMIVQTKDLIHINSAKIHISQVEV